MINNSKHLRDSENALFYANKRRFQLLSNMREREHLGGPGSVILRWIFRTLDVGVWRGSSWLRIGTGGGLL
jgi:hypothetical protein